MVISLAILKTVLLLVGVWLTIYFGTIVFLKFLRGHFIHWSFIAILSAGVTLIVSYFIF